MPENSSRFTLFLTGLLLLGFHADGVLAGEEVIAYESNKFTFGVGVGIVKFDTNVKVTSKASGRSRYIDLEGNLGLPELDRVNTFYGAYRFNEKHSMVFGYFSIDRDSTIVDFSGSFDDVVLVKAKVSIEDNSRFYNIGYGYNLLRDDRSSITLVAGLNTLDLRLKAEASGEITVNGITRSDVVITEGDVLAPLPQFGLNFGFSFTPRLSISTRVSLVGGSYQGVSANVMQASINALYRVSEHSGLLLGITYFDANVDIDGDDDVTEISYGYNGAFVGYHLGI